MLEFFVHTKANYEQKTLKGNSRSGYFPENPDSGVIGADDWPQVLSNFGDLDPSLKTPEFDGKYVIEGQGDQSTLEFSFTFFIHW